MRDLPRKLVTVGDPTQGVEAGMSTCPICGVEWLVTLVNDCMMPACGCYGLDLSKENPHRPCARCGIFHAWNCEKMPQ